MSDVGFLKSDVGFLQVGCWILTCRMSDFGFLQVGCRISDFYIKVGCTCQMAPRSFRSFLP